MMMFRMTRALLLTVAFLALRGEAQDRAELALQAAIHKETVDGDLQGAPARVLAPQRALLSIGPVLRLCVPFI